MRKPLLAGLLTVAVAVGACGEPSPSEAKAPCGSPATPCSYPQTGSDQFPRGVWSVSDVTMPDGTHAWCVVYSWTADVNGVSCIPKRAG